MRIIFWQRSARSGEVEETDHEDFGRTITLVHVGRHRVGLEEILIIAPTKRGEMLTSKDVWASRQLD
jgi:hypothetical protein